MRLIQIHAGIHKTGSTAIQHTLARLVPDLAAHGIALPYFGDRGHWHHALAGFASNPARAAEAWGKLARRVARTDAQRIVLSSEHFIGADPVALQAALTRLGPAQVQIHIYLRPHVALFTSLYLQRVKAGVVTASPLDLAEPYATAREFDYVPALARFTETFGADAVRLREFDPTGFTGGNLIADLWDFLDLPADLLETATEGGDVVVNPTPTAEHALLLLALAGRLRTAPGLGHNPQAMRTTLALLHDTLRARDTGLSTAYRLPLRLQRAIKDHFEPARAALAPRLDRPASAGFLSEVPAPPVPLAPIRFDAVTDSLAATATGLRDRDLPTWAAATERFAARLRARTGDDGTAVLKLPAPRATLLEGAA